MGIRGSPTAELAFSGLRVPGREPPRRGGRRLVDRDAHARSQPARASPPRPSASPRARWRSRRAYARERKQFGQRIGDFQQIGAMLADMDAGVEAARQLLYKACVEIDAGAAGCESVVGAV